MVFILLYHNYYTEIKIISIKDVFLPTIINDESFFFVNTNYTNMSFKQCIRSNDIVSNSIKRIGKWTECQEIFDIWNESTNHGIFMDLGANIGSCSFLFAEVGINVYAFEPLPNNLFLFSLTTFTNNRFRKYITIYPYALGKENKNKTIYIPKNNWGGSSMYVSNNDYNEIVHVKKLDYFEKIIPNKISMIKIDVEGGEYDLIKSGFSFFKTHKTEYMYIEANCGKEDVNGLFEVENLYMLLNEIGYDIIRKYDCNKIKKFNIIVKKKKDYSTQ